MGFLLFVVAYFWVMWLCSDEREQAKFDKSIEDSDYDYMSNWNIYD